MEKVKARRKRREALNRWLTKLVGDAI